MLTYCTNIHAGEGWREVRDGVHANVPRVMEGLGLSREGEPFPLSLWLSGRAARELDEGEASAFGDWCTAQNARVRSINGFPYGAFHGVRVKERAYLPDWRDPERLAHTVRLGEILARWLPGGVGPGVISTVPLGFASGKGPDRTAREDWSAARANVLAALQQFDRIAQATGKELVLAIEAEPACALETTPEVIDFFDALALPEPLARHAGICFDCCHHAVEFESPARSLAALAAAGVRVAQAHVTCALRVPGGELSRLAPFDEPTYLHQTVGRRSDGTLVRFPDLPQALAAEADAGVEEWRTHFHVPVFAERLGDLRTTQPELREMLGALAPEVPLVVETYTFGVLPKEQAAPSLTDSVVRELAYVRGEVARLRADAKAVRE